MAHSRLSAALADAEPTLARLASRLCANRADACDLVQDTFERAARQGLPADVRNPRAWLITILRNLFVDRCRAAGRRPTLEPLGELAADAAEPPAEPPWRRLGLADVRAAVAELEPAYREVFVLFEFEHWSYERLAARLSIERVTVGTRLTRARRKLRGLLAARLSPQN
jgi:RNA polymerase sigma-70 factor, ECF subfamily